MDKNPLFLGLLQEISPFSHPSNFIQLIKNETTRLNQDNISRTVSYQNFYFLHPDIEWSFLASMVSRNAGWNMCDLQSEPFQKALQKHVRREIFLTYEKANWLIFQDAYPQLLIYHLSSILGQPLFHLLPALRVSAFMKKEWERYWKTKDRKRLVYALIINEQHVIEQPVIKHPYYQRGVFHRLFFLLQDRLHFSSVLFPTLTGRLYGANVSHFSNVNQRIKLGKCLYHILFHPLLIEKFMHFAIETKHTGSRHDYEQFGRFSSAFFTPKLREVYPPEKHHIHEIKDWSNEKNIRQAWFNNPKVSETYDITKWFDGKRKQLLWGLHLLKISSDIKKIGPSNGPNGN
jgi:hypothetical protein